MFGLSLAFAAAAITLALLLAWAARTPGPSELARWADRYELDLRRDDRSWVARELRRGRVLRTLGFMVTFGTGMGMAFWWGGTHLQPGPPFPLSILGNPAAWATGYLVGATVAELTRRRPGAPRVRAAALVPRRLGDYLPAWMPWIERVVALVVVGLTPLAGRTVPGRSPRVDLAIAAGVAAVGVVAMVEVALRWMVGRPQPVASPDELAVDDALRSTAIHRAAGAGLAALLFLLGRQLGSSVGRPWELAGLVYLGCYGLAIGAWKDLTVPLRWRVRRAYGSGASGQTPMPRHDPGRGPA
jgi:hypothetical protein